MTLLFLLKSENNVIWVAWKCFVDLRCFCCASFLWFVVMMQDFGFSWASFVGFRGFWKLRLVCLSSKSQDLRSAICGYALWIHICAAMALVAVKKCHQLELELRGVTTKEPPLCKFCLFLVISVICRIASLGNEIPCMVQIIGQYIKYWMIYIRHVLYTRMCFLHLLYKRMSLQPETNMNLSLLMPSYCHGFEKNDC